MKLNNDAPQKVKTIYYGLILSYIVFFIAVLVTRGDCWQNIFFNAKYGNNEDLFMDFFNSVVRAGDFKQYKEGDIYPAFTSLVYKFFRKLIPHKLLGNPFSLRISQAGMITFLAIEIITFFLLYSSVKTSFNSDDSYAKQLTIVLLFSFPFLYAIERGNIILIALLFLVFFLKYHDSNNKIMKELALISLGISACIKIYPAIFGAILLKKGSLKDAARCFVYGLVIFVAPFFLWGGLSDIYRLIKNIMATSDAFGKNNIGFDNGIRYLVKCINAFCGVEIDLLLVRVVVIVMLITTFTLTRRFWEKLLCCSLFCILLPGFSYSYSLVFIIIPIIYFCTEEKKESLTDLVYSLLFALTVVVLPFSGFTTKYENCIYRIPFCVAVEDLTMILLIVLVFTETIIYRFREGTR